MTDQTPETQLAVINTKLDGILNQTTRTNGRVSKLETVTAGHDSDIKTLYLELSNKFGAVSEQAKEIKNLDDKLTALIVKQARESGLIGLVKQIVGTGVSVTLLAVLAKFLGLIQL